MGERTCADNGFWDLPLNILDLPGDIIGVIICPESIGEICCTMMYLTSKRASTVMNKKYVLRPSRICEGAASAGHLGILKWGRNCALDCDKQVATAAAAAGHMHIIKYLQKVEVPTDNPKMVAAAALNGHLNVVETLGTYGCWGRDAYYNAAEGGHVEILSYLYGNVYKHHHPGDKLMGHAARYGRINILERFGGYHAYKEVVRNAIVYDQPEVLDWWISRGGEIDLYDLQEFIPMANDRIRAWFIGHGYPDLGL